jgi:uncharacterized protein YkwD
MEIGPITFSKDIINGEAIFTNTRIPVKAFFNSIDSGESIDDFLKSFPEVSKEQLVEVLGFAKTLITSLKVIKANGTLLNILDNPFIPTTDILKLEKDISNRINEHRRTLELDPFSFNDDMATIARVHSIEMAKQITPFDHTGFERRIAQAKQIVHESSGGAENLASGFNNAQDLLQSWLNDPGHKKNIESNLKFAGIGVGRSKEGPNFFTLLII